MKKMELLASSLRESWQARKIDRVLRSSSGGRLSSSSCSPANDSLFKRISPIGQPSVSMVPILDEWAQEGLPIHPDELSSLVKRLTRFKRFSHALQVSEWSENMSFESSPNDIARKLSLISRVQGLKQAEEYFSSLPVASRTPQVYYALLSCYVHVKSQEKAEDLMCKLKKLGLANITLPYNVMTKLYCTWKMYEKADCMMQEMEERDIRWDKFTYNIRLNAYAAACDIRGMELLLRKMEGDPWHMVDWVVYSVAANGYLNAGLIDKSLIMLKRVEKLGIARGSKLAYATLLTLYGRAKKKDEVYRIWHLHKSSSDGVNNRSYLHMVSSLVKADDIEGAEKIVEEYNSQAKSFDYRIANVLVRAYGVKGDMEKARAMAKKGVEHGKEPLMSTWDILAAGYCEHNQMEDALEAFKKALVADRQGWRLNRLTALRCLNYIKRKGDPREVEEFTRLVLDRTSPSETLILNDFKIRSVETNVDDQIDDGDGMLKVDPPLGYEQ